MRIAPFTARDYYVQLPTDRREALERIRTCILQLWPAAKEDMAYGMPTYSLDGKPLFALASQKHFLVLYVIPYDLLDAFKHELVLYNRGKSCIRLRRVDEAALALLDRVVRFVGATHTESRLRLKPMVRRSNGLVRDPVLAPVLPTLGVPSGTADEGPIPIGPDRAPASTEA